MMSEIILIGGGEHAKVVVSVIRKIKKFKIIGYVDIENQGNLLGIVYLGNDDVLPDVKMKYPSCSAIISIGMLSTSDAQKREQLYHYAKSLGYKFPPIISPNAVINDNIKIGDGTVIFDGVIMNVGTIVGIGVILNTGSSIDHDCDVGNFSHIAPGVVLSGGVKIGKQVLIGVGSIITEHKVIIDNSIIGAGSLVVKDITEPGMYLGNPARLIL